MSKKFIDAKKLKCPMPIVKISKEIKLVEVGEHIQIAATDPVFKPDLEAWCRQTGNELVEFKEESDYFLAIVEKKAA